ncbi:MAG: phytoene/squalene synthase family protein [Myxococcota bacterium]
MTSALVHEGYARAKAVTRRHAKSFFFSSVALFGQRRRAAFALYAFCRRLDDLVDGDNAGDGRVAAPAAVPSQLSERLALARSSVAALYGRESTGVFRELPWHESEFAAFRDTVERYGIPERPFQELINGMEMDLVKSRYATYEELELYCYRVAGVVGLMMTPVLGYRDERCLAYAADLGTAMQLTNILRDVKEDLARGRVYLPQDELAAHGVTDDMLAAGAVTPQWRGFMRAQVARARTLYARAARGVPDLTGFGSQRVVRLMGTLYGGILDVIEARDFDVFSSRASVPFGRKLALAAGVLLTPNPKRPSLSPRGEGRREGLAR